MITLVKAAHQDWTCSTVIGVRVVSQRATWGESWWTCTTSSRPVRHRQCLVAAGEVAQGDGAAHVQGLVAAGLGEPGGAGTQGVFEVEGVGQVEDRLDPLAVDVDVAGLRDRYLVGVEAVRASVTRRSTWAKEIVETAWPNRASTKSAPSTGRAMVASAIRPAFHTDNRPEVTAAHRRGSRWRSSNARAR